MARGGPTPLCGAYGSIPAGDAGFDSPPAPTYKGFPVGPGSAPAGSEITGRESMGRMLSLLVLPFLVISALVTAVLLTAYAWLTQGD